MDAVSSLTFLFKTIFSGLSVCLSISPHRRDPDLREAPAHSPEVTDPGSDRPLPAANVPIISLTQLHHTNSQALHASKY